MLKHSFALVQALFCHVFVLLFEFIFNFLLFISFIVACLLQYEGRLFLIAGDFTGGGEYANSVYASVQGIFCDIGGTICGGQ